jgi:hypothetical protein
MEMVVSCSLLVEESVRGGILTMAGSWWGKNVITPKCWDVRIDSSNFFRASTCLIALGLGKASDWSCLDQKFGFLH